MPTPSRREFLAASAALVPAAGRAADPAPAVRVADEPDRVRVAGSALEAAVRKTGYVSGVEGGSLLDRATGARDLGFGLDVVDWLMEPGSDAAYRDKLPGDLPYLFDNLVHGKRAKRSVEGPQICTKARKLTPVAVAGKDFAAVTQSWTYTLAAPGKTAGSVWEQTLVFPAGERYFLAADRVTTVNASDALFLRTDLPGHIKHKTGDTFSEVYLSYHGTIPAKEFLADFAPDEKFLYVRDDGKVPKRMIRAYRTRDPETGRGGPWVAGMTLDPGAVSEGWCHQRGYVCMIQEIGGRPVKAGDVFGAAYLIGFFDSVADMERVYDRYAGHRGLRATADGWKLTRTA
jgi:hypothetical protein